PTATGVPALLDSSETESACRGPPDLSRQVRFVARNPPGSPRCVSGEPCAVKAARTVRRALEGNSLTAMRPHSTLCATWMGRLVLNVLLSFAQFERELIAERTRDKMAAARRKGKWAGGLSILGYDVDAQIKKLV